MTMPRQLTPAEHDLLIRRIRPVQAEYAAQLVDAAAALEAASAAARGAQQAVHDGRQQQAKADMMAGAVSDKASFQAYFEYRRQLEEPVIRAQEAVTAAQDRLTALTRAAKAAELTAAFLAGARSGFRWGHSATIQAVGLQNGEYLSLGSREEALASLTMAMTDDQVADQILTALAIGAESKESLPQ